MGVVREDWTVRGSGGQGHEQHLGQPDRSGEVQTHRCAVMICLFDNTTCIHW